MKEHITPTQAMQALRDGLAGFAMALANRMPPEHAQALANDLARLAINAEKHGNTALESLFIDLQSAVRPRS